MAHSADTDGYDDFGLSPLRQKAFGKSALTRQTKAAPVEEASRSISWGWVVRLLFGLLILGAGIYAVFYIADQRKQVAATESQPADTQRVATSPSGLKPSSRSSEDTSSQTSKASSDTAWSQPQTSEPATAPVTETAASAAQEAKPTRDEEAALGAPAIKYYSIVGSYSDYAHALENKQKLRLRTRIVVTDGKYRLVSDSVTSTKPASYLIDSLRRKRPNDWLAKAK